MKTLGDHLRSIGLMFDYHFSLYKDKILGQDDQERFYRLFENAILNGTIVGNNDPTELFWPSWDEAETVRILGRVTKFLEFAADYVKPSGTMDGFRAVVGAVLADARERRFRNRAYSFFAHLIDQSGSGRPTYFAHSHARNRRAIGFPSDRLHDLISFTLENGRACRATRVRDAMAFLLMAYGGLRTSEIFHLWINDVIIVDGLARVFVHDPQYSKIELNGKLVTRQEYLRQVYDAYPRTLAGIGDSARAGWKGMAHDYGGYSVVYWIHPDIGKFYADLHIEWVTQLRPSTADHPYYFVSMNLNRVW